MTQNQHILYEILLNFKKPLILQAKNSYLDYKDRVSPKYSVIYKYIKKENNMAHKRKSTKKSAGYKSRAKKSTRKAKKNDWFLAWFKMSPKKKTAKSSRKSAHKLHAKKR